MAVILWSIVGCTRLSSQYFESDPAFVNVGILSSIDAGCAAPWILMSDILYELPGSDSGSLLSILSDNKCCLNRVYKVSRGDSTVLVNIERDSTNRLLCVQYQSKVGGWGTLGSNIVYELIYDSSRLHMIDFYVDDKPRSVFKFIYNNDLIDRRIEISSGRVQDTLSEARFFWEGKRLTSVVVSIRIPREELIMYTYNRDSIGLLLSNEVAQYYGDDTLVSYADYDSIGRLVRGVIVARHWWVSGEYKYCHNAVEMTMKDDKGEIRSHAKLEFENQILKRMSIERKILPNMILDVNVEGCQDE